MSEPKEKKEKDFDDILKKVIRDKLHKLIGGHVTAHLISSHRKQTSPKKKVSEMHDLNEEAPTNVMGDSSSTAGTGPIDTFDPILNFKKIMRRRKPKI